MKNYLPFALRETRQVSSPFTGTGPPIQSVQVTSLDMGFGQAAILGDLCVYARQAAGTPSTQLLMRLGWLGKGFLLEKRMPAGLFLNKSRPSTSVWKFPRPYVLWPNQNLRARIIARGDRSADQGIMFNGVRLVDNRPCLLYDSDENNIAAAAGVALAGPDMRCPGDSPVALHSVTVPNWVYAPEGGSSEVQIWSPQGREWFQVAPFVAAPPAPYQKWIDAPVGMLALGEDRGWYMGRGQTLLIEFENAGGADMSIMVTLRGSIEIDEEERHG